MTVEPLTAALTLIGMGLLTGALQLLTQRVNKRVEIKVDEINTAVNHSDKGVPHLVQVVQSIESDLTDLRVTLQNGLGRVHDRLDGISNHVTLVDGQLISNERRIAGIENRIDISGIEGK